VLAPEGWPFILGGAALTAAAYFLWPRGIPVAVAGLLFTLFSVWFFRSPNRTPPSGTGLVVAPADGKVVFAGECSGGRYVAEGGRKVSIFMSLLDVHVNRAPVSGRVESVRYNRGKFHVASVDKASLDNEQNGVAIITREGRTVTYVQIAGMVARRIVCDVAAGDLVRQGQRVGMIRFGSRLDVYLPADARLTVRRGDRVLAGESVIGAFP
jgi:phosphatidylserine decarboxylase